MNTNKLKHALHHDATPGVLLMIAMVAALIVANSGAEWYGQLLETYATAAIGDWGIKKPLLLWINDGLMAVFFLLVGLELKREVLFGELSDRRKIVLPLLGAIGGIAIPSGIYAWVNWGDELAMNGWAIPAATDIAFALGILALLGSRVPVALKILLTSIAVIDDLAAILIIAIFYTDQLSVFSLATAATVLLALFGLNKAGVKNAGPFVVLGIILWVAVLKSGVHATLAGVALAAFIPAGKDAKDKSGLAYKMEHALHPWVVFAILPIFAFANAGVPIIGMSPAALLEPVPLGIAAGLFFGKQIGVFGASLIAVKSGLAKLPTGVNWMQIYGLSALCGIGFTMSLFIGGLAFEGAGGPDYAVDDRIGILTGSFLSAIVGVIFLKMACRGKAAVAEEHALDGGLLGPHEETK
ncbi:UNVERIFIED_CONTAM: hypothetical protein GTU68_056224 [Idotea baltica]|nr:hypothetical protein [Idotea baltica]